MPLQKLNKNYCKVPKQNHGKTNNEYAEDMQNSTKKWRTLKRTPSIKRGHEVFFIYINFNLPLVVNE